MNDRQRAIVKIWGKPQLWAGLCVAGALLLLFELLAAIFGSDDTIGHLLRSVVWVVIVASWGKRWRDTRRHVAAAADEEART